MINTELHSHDTDKEALISNITKQLSETGYTPVEINNTKPWGSYIRLANSDAEQFLNEYFPGISLEEAQLGVEGAELSPKILIVSPGQRLSWQYHFNRAERWRFLTDGAYRKSSTDIEGERIEALADTIVQFTQGERHRLEGLMAQYVFVAEIWQHINPTKLSDEEDIIRIQDDYVR